MDINGDDPPRFPIAFHHDKAADLSGSLRDDRERFRLPDEMCQLFSGIRDAANETDLVELPDGLEVRGSEVAQMKFRRLDCGFAHPPILSCALVILSGI